MAILSTLGIFAFKYPEYLTTPELRAVYSEQAMRFLLFAALLLSGSISIVNSVLNQQRWLNGVTLALVLYCILMGGSNVAIGNVRSSSYYVGLDWFILDLLFSSVTFLVIEKLTPLYKNQSVFRIHWQVDLKHFFFNHMLIGFMLLVVNFFIHNLFTWAVYPPLQLWIQNLHYGIELLLAILVADLVQYWTHRAYHVWPFMWKFHAMHHSAKVLDWLAGSRLHFFEIIITRVAILGVLYVVGFSKSVLDAYIIIVGFQAVLNHSNVKLPWGWLRYIIVTPEFHHWHHSSDQEAIDKNFAAHFSFLDYLFGSVVRAKKPLPEKYGIIGDDMPDGFIAQQSYPFQKRTE